MSRWARVGRAVLADPERVGFLITAAAFIVCAVGLARTVGVEVHPAAGWAIGLLAAGVPAGWLGKRVVDHALNERDRARNAARRGEPDGVPEDLRETPRGEPRNVEEDSGEGRGAPAPGWPRGR